jgi:hypothetical protein
MLRFVSIHEMTFEILTVMNMNIVVVCVVTPVIWIGGVQRLGGTYWLHTRRMVIVCSCEKLEPTYQTRRCQNPGYLRMNRPSARA